MMGVSFDDKMAEYFWLGLLFLIIGIMIVPLPLDTQRIVIGVPFIFLAVISWMVTVHEMRRS